MPSRRQKVRDIAGRFGMARPGHVIEMGSDEEVLRQQGHGCSSDRLELSSQTPLLHKELRELTQIASRVLKRILAQSSRPGRTKHMGLVIPVPSWTEMQRTSRVTSFDP